MRLKKKFVPQKFYTPPPGISNGPPLRYGLLNVQISTHKTLI